MSLNMIFLKAYKCISLNNFLTKCGIIKFIYLFVVCAGCAVCADGRNEEDEHSS
jgi:hypothetical protein